jgi:hypothetical protein
MALQTGYVSITHTIIKCPVLLPIKNGRWVAFARKCPLVCNTGFGFKGPSQMNNTHPRTLLVDRKLLELKLEMHRCLIDEHRGVQQSVSAISWISG